MPTVPVQKYYSLTVVERGLMVYPLLKGRIPPHSLHLQGQIARTVQFSSVAQSFLTLCDPMDCSTPGFPVHNQLPELTQTHVHWVSNANQPSHPLSFPSPPTFNLFQHQSLFQ